MAKTHPLNLTRTAAHLLAQVLSVPGLTKDTGHLFRAGQVNEDHLSEVGGPPFPNAKADDADKVAKNKAWGNEPFPAFEVTERQRETLKALVGAGIEVIPPGKHTNVLLRELGMSPEDG